MNKIELGACPQNQVLSQAGEMYRQQRSVGAKLQREIAVAHCIHRILRHLDTTMVVYETERARHKLTLQRQGRTRERSCAEGGDVHPFERLRKPFGVTVEHFN